MMNSPDKKSDREKSQPVSIEDRLAKLVDVQDVFLLQALFERMDRYSTGVDAERFRIDHKDKRHHINKLVGRFIKEEYEPGKTYRLNLIALPLIDNERSREILKYIDDVLGYLSTEYEKEPGRQITLMEISHDTEIRLAMVADAMGFLIDTPVAGGRRAGIPNTPDWYMIPGEQSLDYPDLDSVLHQLIEWAEWPAGVPTEPSPSEETPGYMARTKNWIAQNRILSVILAIFAVVVTVTGFLADAASVLSFFGQIIPAP